MASSRQQERIFVTGASGYIGSVVTGLAIANGYKVHGLSRSEAGDSKIRSLGAVPVRGDLTSLDVLRHESAQADIVLHLASAFNFGLETYDDAMPTDIAAVDAIGDGLAGTDKPLVITSGTLLVPADPTGAETTEASPMDYSDPKLSRSKTERHSLALADRGIRVTGIRLAPYVYGRNASGIKLFMDMSARAGSVMCIDGGENYTTVVHVDDAAQLYLLAAKKGKAGEVFNASAATDVTAGQIFNAIAETLRLPMRDLTYAEAIKQLGHMVAWFLAAENRGSGGKARKELGWQPSGMGVLEEIRKGSYYQGLKGSMGSHIGS